MYNIPTGGTPITPGENSTDNGGVVTGRPSQFMVDFASRNSIV